MATLVIEIPDELREQGEAFAAVLRRLPPEALRAYLEDLADDAWCAHLAREAEARLESGQSCLLDWEDVEAELNELPDSGRGGGEA
ncbi:MAG: hypothetical protein HY321_06880 [Armatimonadetes bacterium]|nr:hypothetical protein [Armatimonadota bacterium]